ncbi:TATA binding protein of transcription factor IIIC (nucleomorph) [Chroomonas mesostigmatica CCMP1168]|uniref:TATA binding protein of transcription factor IIIC n=1 Tax=Chroomonas mesostigmatica CCMP1168 TaxID=1195612 RepID=J7G153_9CRYP|nr:TATA binding protein of transcription factor IIIC [Chroomonas mesostigmatica CCMP1168]
MDSSKKKKSSMSKKNLSNFSSVFEKLSKKTLFNAYLLKFLGLIYEYVGKHILSLKIYFIFFQKNNEDKISKFRITLISFWDNIFRFQKEKFFNLSIGNIFLFSESIVFNSKIQQKKGNWIPSFFLWKKLNRLYFLGLRKTKSCLKSDFSTIFYFNFWIRILKRKNENKKQKKKTVSFFSTQKDHFTASFKLFFITLQNYIQIKEKNLFKKKKFHYLICSFIFSKKIKKPLIFDIWKTISLENFKNYLEKDLKIFFYIIALHFKWFVTFSIQWLRKKKTFLSFLVETLSIRNLKIFKESYNPIFRNFRNRNNILSKIALLQMKRGLFIQAMNWYSLIGKQDMKSVEILNIIALIREKISSKKEAFETFFKGIRVYFQRKMTIPEKYIQKKNFVLKIIEKIENFFEKGKIFGLSRLIISILLLRNKKIFSFIRFNEIHKKKKKKEKKILKFSLKNYLNKIFSLEDSLNFTHQKLFQEFLDSLFIVLAEIIFFALRKNKIFGKNKGLTFLVSNNIFYQESSYFIKYFNLSILINKKKFKKAYHILRLQCIKDPYSFNKWCLLSRLENQLGFLISKTLRYSLRLLIKNPNSVPAMIFTGNHCSFFGSYGYSLAEYFQAYRWRKDSPFLNFLISVQYLNGSLSRKILNREFSIFTSLSFFTEYKKLRLFLSQVNLKRNKWSKLLEIETIYNTARLYLFLGLKYQALKNFQKAMKWSGVSLAINKSKRRVKNSLKNILEKEILFNIFILFRSIGNNFSDHSAEH